MLFTSAKHFVGRLSEVEKITIRLASDNEARHDWLFYNRHRNEIVGTDKEGLKLFREATKIILKKFYADCAGTTFGRTWTF